MRNWLKIVGREYKTRVRRRAFILSTLLGPVMMVGFIALIVLLTKSQESNSKILVVDSNEILSFHVEDKGQIPSCFECFPEREFLEYRFSTEGLSTEEFLESDYDGILEDRGRDNRIHLKQRLWCVRRTSRGVMDQTSVEVFKGDGDSDSR